MMAKLMVDSAVTWARDYRIDSFRFDLMGTSPGRRWPSSIARQRRDRA